MKLRRVQGFFENKTGTDSHNSFPRRIPEGLELILPRNRLYAFQQRKGLNLIFVCPCIAMQFQITTNKMQRFLIYLFLQTFYTLSGGSSAHYQGHITANTASEIVNQYCCLLLSRIRWLTIPEAVCTVMCS